MLRRMGGRVRKSRCQNNGTICIQYSKRRRLADSPGASHREIRGLKGRTGSGGAPEAIFDNLRNEANPIFGHRVSWREISPISCLAAKRRNAKRSQLHRALVRAASTFHCSARVVSARDHGTRCPALPWKASIQGGAAIIKSVFNSADASKSLDMRIMAEPSLPNALVS